MLTKWLNGRDPVPGSFSSKLGLFMRSAVKILKLRYIITEPCDSASYYYKLMKCNLILKNDFKIINNFQQETPNSYTK